MLDTLDKRTIEEVKKVLKNYINKPIKIKYNLGRNKCETYNVMITNLYNCVFTVKDIKKGGITKSFSYVDIITKTIKIYEK